MYNREHAGPDAGRGGRQFPCSRLSTGRELGEGTGHGLPKGTVPWFAAGLKSVCREHSEDLPGRGEGRWRRDCVNVGGCEAGGRAFKGRKDGGMS